MRIHTLSFAADDFAAVHVDRSGLPDDAFVARGESKRDTWQPYEARWERESGRPLPGFTMLMDIPVFTTEAQQALEPVLEGRGEVLPLNVTDAPPDAVAFNVTRVVDALDEDRSEIKRMSSGKVMRIARPVFIPERIADATIFKVTTYPRALYVTGTFLEAAEAAGVQGLRLSENWAGDDGEAAEPGGERVYTQVVPETGPPDEPVAHHIIPPLDLPSDSLQAAQAHAQKLGIEPDEAANGVALARARHQQAYTDRYFDALWERFRTAEDRDSGVAVLQGIGQELVAGEFPPSA
jgi:hypothetical protein